MAQSSLLSLAKMKAWIKPGEFLIFQQVRVAGRLKTPTFIDDGILEAGFSVKIIGHPTEDTWEVTTNQHGTTIEATVHGDVFLDFYVTK